MLSLFRGEQAFEFGNKTWFTLNTYRMDRNCSFKKLIFSDSACVDPPLIGSGGEYKARINQLRFRRLLP